MKVLIYNSVIGGFKMNDGKDIYTEEGMENYIEGDEISAEEQGFMLGYLEA